MAIMIPSTGPVGNDSTTAEPDIYWRLARQLDSEFVVIHSLPWVSTVAHEVDGRKVPTGELDFLILHPLYGALALEVKGGVVAYHESVFVLRNGKRIDPITQVRRGTHALASWLFNSGSLALRIGYGIVLPHSDLKGRSIPPALIDQKPEDPQSIVFDKNDLRDFGNKVIQLMQYWKAALGGNTLGVKQLNRIKELICPIADYRPKWHSRIEEVSEKWLILTDQQQRYLDRLKGRAKSVLTGRSGTGKTLLASTYARDLATSGKVLFLVFNNELSKKLDSDLKDVDIKVLTFHKLCLIAARALKTPIPQELTSEWFKETAPKLLQEAVSQGTLKRNYAALVIDEAQILEEPILKFLVEWFSSCPVLVCCDETQVFPYETLTPTERIVEILQIEAPFLLTVNLRSPKAVFERVQEVFPAMIQEDTKRPDEDDTLEEVAVFNPLMKLYETIQNLHKEGVDRDHITVVYIRSKPMFPSDFDEMLNQNLEEVGSKYRGKPNYQQAVRRIREQYGLYAWYHSQRDIESMFSKVISIGKFRGLESPIIVVYADGKLDHASLACAYTRTTTKCIVIYNMLSFFKEDELNVLQRIVIRDVKSIRSEVEARWPPEKAMSLTLVISGSTTIYWSNAWGGWVFWEQWAAESVVANLWLYHLIENFPYAFYVINTRYEPWSVTKVTAERNSVSFGFNWCDECKAWTRWATQENDERYCLDCEDENTEYLPDTDIAVINRQYWLLTNSNATREERRGLSAFQKAILYWDLLDEASKELLRPRLRESGNVYGNEHYRFLLRLLTGVDILRTTYGAIITRDALKEKYQRWFPDIKLSDIEWRNELTYGLNNWIQHGLIKKVNKNVSAKYVRIEQNEEGIS